MKKIYIIADDSSETRAKVILYSGLKDQSRLLTFVKEDTKTFQICIMTKRIKEGNTFHNSLTNFVQKFTFLK
jgi:hypothetical protein